jgi:gliding motility-associated-like protein
MIMTKRVIFLLMILSLYQSAMGQAPYDNCNNALELCPNSIFNVSNLSTNSTVCTNCEDDFNYCFAPSNSIWLTFTTNTAGGNVSVDFSNLNFETNLGQGNSLQAAIIEAGVACNSSTYSLIGTCLNNETTNFTMVAPALSPNTTYYIIINGSSTGVGVTSPAECTLDLMVSGPGIDRPISTISVIESATNICLNDVVLFSASIIDCPDNTNYNWYINGVLVAITNDTIYETSAINNGDVITVSTDCYLQCPATVSVNSNPISVFTITVNAGTDFTIKNGESIQLNGITSSPVYYWTPSFLLSNPNTLNPIANPEETTTYALTAEENGCALSDYVTITVEKDLIIPNTFSPNNDNNNDTWSIPGIEKYPDNTVIVYDRWGQEVFNVNGYSVKKEWNGEIRGRQVNEGVYYYVIDLKDGSDLRKGTLTILK